MCFVIGEVYEVRTIVGALISYQGIFLVFFFYSTSFISPFFYLQLESPVVSDTIRLTFTEWTSNF